MPAPGRGNRPAGRARRYHARRRSRGSVGRTTKKEKESLALNEPLSYELEIVTEAKKRRR
jgi:hypothetical protein